MKYLLILVLFCSCIAFGQVNNEYTADEVLEYFSSNFEIKEILYEKLYQSSFLPDGSWKLTEEQKISEYISFSKPFKVNKPLDLENQLFNDNQKIHTLALEVAQRIQIDYGKTLLMLEEGNISTEHLEILKKSYGDDFDLDTFLKDQKKKVIEENLAGDLDKLYEKNLAVLSSFDLEHYQDYYLLPTYYKKQHSGYIIAPFSKFQDLDTYKFEEVKISKYTSWESLALPHYPLRITSEKAKAIANIKEEPVLIDLIHKGRYIAFSYVKNIPNFNEQLYWLFDEAHLVINLKTGAQYQLQNTEGSPTSVTALSFDTSQAPNKFSLAAALELKQEAKYKYPAFKIRAIKNKRLIVSIITTFIQVLIVIFLILLNRNIRIRNKLLFRDVKSS